MNRVWKRKLIAPSSPLGSTILSGTKLESAPVKEPPALRFPQESAKNWQAEAWPNREIQACHPFQRRMQLRVVAWLQRDHKGQGSLLKSRLLQQRIDVEVVIGQNLRQPRHNPGLIPDEESQIPGSLEITANPRCRDVVRYVSLSTSHSLSHEHDVRYHGHRRGIAAGTRPQESHISAK